MYWFGTSQGLISYDGFEFHQYSDSLVLDNTIYSIQTYGNKAWIGTANGLVYFDGKSFSQFQFSQNESNSNCR